MILSSTDYDLFKALGCLLGAIILGICLANHNLKVAAETREERLRIYRIMKARKNAALKKKLGLD